MANFECDGWRQYATPCGGGVGLQWLVSPAFSHGSSICFRMRFFAAVPFALPSDKRQFRLRFLQINGSSIYASFRQFAPDLSLNPSSLLLSQPNVFQRKSWSPLREINAAPAHPSPPSIHIYSRVEPFNSSGNHTKRRKRKKKWRLLEEEEEENVNGIIIICVHHHQEEREGPSRELLPEAKEGTLPLFLYDFLSVLLVEVTEFPKNCHLQGVPDSRKQESKNCVLEHQKRKNDNEKVTDRNIAEKEGPKYYVIIYMLKLNFFCINIVM
ncbi:uncharacterized protein [Arachis hypogaea]|uniref:uncharacterized protein n=1 Tax=Arachis hypogaea TaxID=3818 RepID=UPI003B2253E9